MAELHLLREAPIPDVGNLFPVRSRLALLFPDILALWLPDPTVARQGGYSFRERALSKGEMAIWRAINGTRTIRQVAVAAGTSAEVALDFFRTLTDPGVQALQLRNQPATAKDPAMKRILCASGFGRRQAHQYGEYGETTLERWHQEDVADGERHFDDRETTVAHAFALPHPALGGMPYGERLYRTLKARGLPLDGSIVEVGPGDGELAEAFLRASGIAPSSYTRVDVAPELLRVQRQRVPGTREHLGKAQALPFPDRSVDLLVSNEVIADLSAVPYGVGDRLEGAVAEVAARLRRYGIQAFPGRASYNLGAWLFLEEIDRVLAADGAAWLSEFGTLEEPPEETSHLDHPEVSIHFGHLEQVARARGFSVRCEPLAEMLGFDLGTRQLARHSYEALRARYRMEGRHLPARAYTPETLTLPWTVEGLSWSTVADFGPGPLVTRFFALTLRRS